MDDNISIEFTGGSGIDFSVQDELKDYVKDEYLKNDKMDGTLETSEGSVRYHVMEVRNSILRVHAIFR